MGYAKYVGRVGALAITLGVGVALASTPGVAYAEPSGASSAGDSSSTSTSTDRDSASNGGVGENNASNSDSDSSSNSAGGFDTDSDSDGPDIDADTDVDTDDVDTDTDTGAGEGNTTPAEDDEAHGSGDSTHASVSGGEAERRAPSRSTIVQDPYVPDDSGASEPDAGLSTEVGLTAEAVEDLAAVSDIDPVEVTNALAVTSPVTAVSTPPAPAPSSALVNVTAAVASTGLQPVVDPGPAAPTQAPMMLAALAAVRDELERSALRSDANAVAQPFISLAADPSPNVLVIGVDGTNLSKVLADPGNANFFELMQDGTTAPASIVGHTTISGPSWSTILTGVWGETTGVINNVFTPWTYDTWATVFNQLETFNPAIQTTSIADWDVISAIAAAGSIPADTVVNIPQVPGDTDWLLTDDAVGDATELAIAVASPDVPNFVFSYFVGVDENGHMYGGDSPQYAAAINNVDRNLGEILQAVAAWEALTGEQWTILMTTDHGHQPQKGLGHGFQSPAETSTFVIAENPNLFAAGAINLQGQIVDVTPTVLTLFGATPAAGSEGVSLTDLGDANVFPVNDDEALRAGIEDVIDKYGYPDIGTQLALGLRTIFATVPYVVFGLTNDLTSALQAIADQDIFLISLLAKLAIVPVQFIGDITYVVTNTGAQIVARLTGVTGASIFPLWPPAPPSFPSTPEEATMLEGLACGDAGGASAVLWCGEGSVAV